MFRRNIVPVVLVVITICRRRSSHIFCRSQSSQWLHPRHLPYWSPLEPLPKHVGNHKPLAKRFPRHSEAGPWRRGSQSSNGDGSCLLNRPHTVSTSSQSRELFWTSRSRSGSQNLCTYDRGWHLVHQCFPLVTLPSQAQPLLSLQRSPFSTFTLAVRSPHSLRPFRPPHLRDCRRPDPPGRAGPWSPSCRSENQFDCMRHSTWLFPFDLFTKSEVREEQYCSI